jgi:transcriptional regulator with XRE-family HTH domain
MPPKPFKALPRDFRTRLEPTLARRISQLREFKNMTVQDLASTCRFTVARVEDLEAGLETWLSATDRQSLASALSIEPVYLQEVECRASTNKIKESAAYNQQIIDQITDAIFAGVRDLECPDCGSTLSCSTQEGFDIEGYRVALAKAFCIKCPFILR